LRSGRCRPPSRRRHHVGEQQCDVTGARADVEDLHAGLDAGQVEDLTGEDTHKVVLLAQAAPFAV
jgi:hypothetical protein